MKLNIFSIPTSAMADLKSKLLASDMTVIHQVEQEGWHGDFYYSTNPAPGKIPWAETYAEYFTELPKPSNRNYYAAFLFQRAGTCFALSYGKSHFYIRPFCDYDFGVEVAKRTADESEVKQTASKRFQGKRKKDIASFASNTRLDVPSGESVEYIQAAVTPSAVPVFGTTGKFGTSAQLSPEIKPADLGEFLTKLENELAKPPRFKLPRTVVIRELDDIEKYDQVLVSELTAPLGTTEFAHNSYDLYGVDLVFSTDGSYTLRCPGATAVALDELSIRELKCYIAQNNLATEDILKIRITHEQEGRPVYTHSLKQDLDFIADDDRVLLSGGQWMRFNQDYLEFLDDYMRDIPVEEVEPQFQDITLSEPSFNASQAVLDAGYAVADTDFSIFRTAASTPIEAWDLRRGRTVYAVKFGTAQKLGYVCDQATLLLELLRNRAGRAEIPEFDQYCLWLGYRARGRLTHITETGSIILKQKIEAWARTARDLGITPVIKISRKVREGFDT